MSVLPTKAALAALVLVLAAATPAQARLDAPFGAHAFPAAIGTLPRVLVGDTPQTSAIDPATRTVYVANQNDNSVSVVDARTCNARDVTGCGTPPATIPVADGPFGIAINDATHTIYVTHSYSNVVSVINGRTCNATNTSQCGRTPPTVTVGDGPVGVAVDPATNTVYVTNSGPGMDGSGDTVSVIDGATCNAQRTSGCGQTPATVHVGHLPFFATVDAAHKTLYVTDAFDNAVSMINTATCRAGVTAGCAQVPPTAAVGNFPVHLLVDRRTETLYVGNNNEPTVSVINAATCNATASAGCAGPRITLNVLGGPDALALNEATQTLFVANNGPGPGTQTTSTVSIVDATTCNARTTWGCHRPAPAALTGANPGGLSVDEPTNTVYATTFESALQVINGATCNADVVTGCGQTTPATPAGVDPFSIAVNQLTHTVYVGDGSGHDGFPYTISVLDATTCNPVVSLGCNASPVAIPIDFLPYGVAVNQATNTLYATGLADGNGQVASTLSVIDGASCNASVTSGCTRPPATVTVGSAPAGVAVNEATNTIYVANAGEPTVSIIDGTRCNGSDHSGCTQTPLKVTLAHVPRAIAVNQATNTIYALSPGTAGTVSVINGARCNAKLTTGCSIVPATVTVGNGSPSSRLEGLAVNPATNTIYVLNTGDATVSVINGRTCNAKDTSGCGQTPAHAPVGRERDGSVAVDPVTNLIYVSNGLDGTVSIIDGAACNATDRSRCDRVSPAVPAGPSPNGLAVSQPDHTVYIADNGGGPVSFFNFQAPASPTGVVATRIDRRSARVAWQPPRHGGLPIIYHLIPSPACPTCRGLDTPPTSGAPLTTITGLNPRQPYTFKVWATDAAGTGPASAPSNTITP